jgi:hypothetical protein
MKRRHNMGTTVAGLLKKAQKKNAMINEGKFHLRRYIEPPIEGRKDYPRKPKVASCALGTCYKKRRKHY